MKSIICSVLVGLFLVTVFKYSNVVSIGLTAYNEINRLYHAQEPMSGNITLTSNSSLGEGLFATVFSGKTNDGTPVAIKATSIENLSSYTKEYHCFGKMNATMDKVCEKYGIPFIYYSGDFLNYKTMAMTKLEIDLNSLERKIGGFSLDSILIIVRDLIKTVKFAHSKGVTHKDIHAGNIMTKGANVFLIDFNYFNAKRQSNISDWNIDPALYSDMLSLFSTMCSLVNVDICRNANEILVSDKVISEGKRQMKEEFLRQNMTYPELIEPYAEFYFEVIYAKHKESLPKYDNLHKTFDDVLYTGRNRSERIVFEWLTPEEKAAAMAESILPIESIVFPEENAN